MEMGKPGDQCTIIFWNRPDSYFDVQVPEQPVGSTFQTLSVADPGFPVGGEPTSWGERQLPRQLRFENFVCQNEIIWTLRGVHTGGTPWIRQ